MSETPAKRPAFESASRLLSPVAHDPHMRRPVTTSVAAVLVLLRVIAGVIVVMAIAADWQNLVRDPGVVWDGFDSSSRAVEVGRWLVIGVGGAVLLVDLVLGVFLFLGSNGARVVLMIIAALSISTSFVAWWAQGQEVTIEGTFFSLSLDILLLLALSSRSAAAYARRNERRD